VAGTARDLFAWRGRGLREISLLLRQSPTRDEHLARAKAVLKEVFGYRSFRPGQEDIIATVLSGRDCVGVMPTARANP